MIVAGILFYALYYATSHNFLGTQKGFSHPQQFPMIPVIWLINIWLINHWFMDNWPGWKTEAKTAVEIQAEHRRFADEPLWEPAMGGGLVTGLALGVACFFVAIWAIPVISQSITLIK